MILGNFVLFADVIAMLPFVFATYVLFWQVYYHLIKW